MSLLRLAALAGGVVFTCAVFEHSPLAAQRRPLTDADVERIMPIVRSPYGGPSDAQNERLSARNTALDYLSLGRVRGEPGFDEQHWLEEQTRHAVTPAGSRYLADCSRELPVGAALMPTASGETRSDVFSFTAVHALDGADALEAARRFYEARGFRRAGSGQAPLRLFAPDSTLMVTLHRANPHIGEAFLRPACNRWRGPILELVLVRPSWSEIDEGWYGPRFQAELRKHGVEERDYWEILLTLHYTRIMVLSPDWSSLDATSRKLVAPSAEVYLKHRDKLDALLERVERHAQAFGPP
jgi:hypothetical protein